MLVIVQTFQWLFAAGRISRRLLLCRCPAFLELLNQAGTGLNIAFGLCVGHDSLFFRHSKVPVTVLVAKDRVTGHNAIATLYLYQNYRKPPRPSGF